MLGFQDIAHHLPLAGVSSHIGLCNYTWHMILFTDLSAWSAPVPCRLPWQMLAQIPCSVWTPHTWVKHTQQLYTETYNMEQLIQRNLQHGTAGIEKPTTWSSWYRETYNMEQLVQRNLQHGTAGTEKLTTFQRPINITTEIYGKMWWPEWLDHKAK